MYISFARVLDMRAPAKSVQEQAENSFRADKAKLDEVYRQKCRNMRVQTTDGEVSIQNWEESSRNKSKRATKDQIM